MVKLFSYPFRLNPDGTVATVDDGTDYYGDELAMLILTLPGERELVPEYGIEDPTFSSVSSAELAEKITLFGPPIDIVSVTTDFAPGGKLNIGVNYEPLEETTDTLYYQDADTEEVPINTTEYDEASPDFNFNDATDF